MASKLDSECSAQVAAVAAVLSRVVTAKTAADVAHRFVVDNARVAVAAHAAVLAGLLVAKLAGPMLDSRPTALVRVPPRRPRRSTVVQWPTKVVPSTQRSHLVSMVAGAKHVPCGHGQQPGPVVSTIASLLPLPMQLWNSTRHWNWHAPTLSHGILHVVLWGSRSRPRPTRTLPRRHVNLDVATDFEQAQCPNKWPKPRRAGGGGCACCCDDVGSISHSVSPRWTSCCIWSDWKPELVACWRTAAFPG
jgi:hypothetical protein